MEAIRKDDIFHDELSNRAKNYFSKLDKDERRIVESADINWRPILGRAAAGEGIMYFCFQMLTNQLKSEEYTGNFLDELF